MFLGRAKDAVLGEQAGVVERFVLEAGDGGEFGGEFCGIWQHRQEACSRECRRILRMLALVEFVNVVVAMDAAKLVAGFSRQGSSRADECRGIHAARQTESDRHIAAHVERDGVKKLFAECPGRVLIICAKSPGRGEVIPRCRRCRRGALQVDSQRLASAQLHDAIEHRFRRVVLGPEEEKIPRPRNVDPRGFAGELFDLRREFPAAVSMGEIQRLDPEAVSRGEHPLAGGVHDYKGEHAAQVGEAAGAPLFVSRQKHFRVARRAELSADALSQFDVVVNLAVEDDDRAPGRPPERLVGT